MITMQTQCFLEIVRAGLNFTKAAENLHISQPALSRYIARMEADLNVTLFDTSNKKAVELTSAGKIFYNFYENVYRGFAETMAEAIRASERPMGGIAIAYPYDWDVLDIAAKANHFSEQYPGTNFTFKSMDFDAIAQGLRNGDFDMAFTTLFSVKEVPDIWVRDMEDSPLMLLYSAGTRAPSGGVPIKTTDFKDDTLYVLTSDEASVSREMYARTFLALGYTPKVTILPNSETIHARIYGGRGFMVISERIRIKDHPAFSYLLLGLTDKNILAWRKDNNNIAAHKFIDEYMT